jgi:hypothetical protein
VTQLTDEIFEKLRSRFEVKRCPTSVRLAKCDCEGVIYTGTWAYAGSFQWSSVIIAKTEAKCLKWNERNPYAPRESTNPDLETTLVVTMTGEEFKDILKQARAREAEFLAYAYMPKFNKDCVIINGAVFEQKQLRVGLMYQDNQVFNIAVTDWKKDLPLDKKRGTPELHLVGDKHHIVIFGQPHQEAVEHIGVTSIGYD